MTQELVDKLIDHYDMVINRINETEQLSLIMIILQKSHTNLGICKCALAFGQDVFNNEWILSKIIGEGAYMAPVPQLRRTKSQIIECLQIRVDILKQFPN